MFLQYCKCVCLLVIMPVYLKAERIYLPSRVLLTKFKVTISTALDTFIMKAQFRNCNLKAGGGRNVCASPWINIQSTVYTLENQLQFKKL